MCDLQDHAGLCRHLGETRRDLRDEPAAGEELHRRASDEISTPAIKLQRAVVSAHDQQLSVIKQEPPENQEWIPNLDQEDTKKPPYIKEEEGLESSHKREQLQEQDEADTAVFPVIPVLMMSEDNEEKPQYSKLHLSKSEKVEIVVKRAEQESAANLDQEKHLPPEIEVKIEDSSELETEDSDADWRETEDHPPGSISLLYIEDKRPVTNGRPFCCLQCSKTFKRNAHLTEHMMIHTGEKPHSCSECNKSFNCKGNLTQHMLVHTGEKPYGCSKCGKRFTQKGSLTTHMRTHTGEKPFSCSECQKSFYCKGNLTQHMLVHTREKPFCCSVCAERFTQKAHLTQHMKVHRGEKPFSCKSFTLKGNMIRHMSSHREKKLHQCCVCEKRYKRRICLTKHLKIHTRERETVSLT
ncbi:LOW QUALITY PROTEIN: zinc finger protein 41-like [Xyrichtys novacula]|uniref:LOW QUALITY PROTEIN: zinc finger protein 41-like n=1 Tax=Xyrichtys novacula TaxID=13765 RepID=A0AAV1HAQ8_XYRNO|nr:LOW QUALITY PROTEIN: zinc finger protein 41-like [Xyrichtys novacula]